MTDILQPAAGVIRAARYLPADPASVFWGRLPCAADAPVLTVDAGVEVTIDTLSHEGLLDDQGSDPAAFFAAHGVPREQVLDDAVELVATRRRDPADGPHVVTGPIEIRDAQPGDLLGITIVDVARRVPYGVISNRHGKGALPGEFPRRDGTISIFAAVDGEQGIIPRTAGAEPDVHFALDPFLGIIGVAVAGDERPHSVPPGAHGGNIDIKLLTPGSTLFLPIQVDGALAYVGDPHFAQGDGEVALTALEASLRATVRFTVVPAKHPLAAFGRAFGPFAENDVYWIPTGLDRDLNEAMRKCVRAAIELLEIQYGMDAEHAYAYLSAATDFDISQVVDQVAGVHARIRKADFA